MPTGVYDRLPEEDRFWAKVEKRGPDERWNWTGGTAPGGYGSFWAGNRNVRAPRWSYEKHIGEPGEKFVCHRCDNPKCVNPAHLFLGTQKENLQDMAAKGRGSGPGLYGEDHPAAKLSEKDILAIKSSPLSSRKEAQKYGVEKSTILRVRSGKSWNHAV